MEFPVTMEDRVVGSCALTDQGLYWQIDCICDVVSDRVERLYCGTVKLGVLLLEGEKFVLRRRVSKASVPQLPPKSGVLTLAPVEELQPWQGQVLGCELSGFRLGNMLLFPYEGQKPCPCEPLFCFMEIRGGFWRLPLDGM